MEIPLNASPHRAQFQYQPLDIAEEQIRLCRLRPSTPESGFLFRVEIEHVAIERVIKKGAGNGADAEIPGWQAADSFSRTVQDHSDGLLPARAYTAVSYMWGAQYPRYQVLVGEAFLSISKNLSDFFSVIKNNDDYDIWFWIDQISIDQSNVPERNYQVQRMKRIYSEADKVCVWLGAASYYSAQAFTLLQSSLEHGTHRNHPTIDQIFMKIHATTERTYAFDELMRLPYFSRLWIIQELFAGRNFVIRCGPLSYPSQGFLTHKDLYFTIHRLYSYIRSYPLSGGTPLPEYHPLLWDDNDEPNELSLGRALHKFMNAECADERDKVFGLMGCVKESERVDVDYSLSVMETFWTTVNKMCECIVKREHLVTDPDRLRFGRVVKNLRHTMNLAYRIPDKELENRLRPTNEKLRDKMGHRWHREEWLWDWK